MATSKKRTSAPSRGDFTGQAKVKQDKAKQEEQKEAAKRMAMVNAQKEEVSQAVVDLTKKEPEVVEPEFTELNGEAIPADTPDPVIDEVVANAPAQPVTQTVATSAEDVTVLGDMKTKIRARYDLTNVTVGRGTDYTFEEGRKYIVPKHVADHLEERDLVEVLG